MHDHISGAWKGLSFVKAVEPYTVIGVSKSLVDAFNDREIRLKLGDMMISCIRTARFQYVQDHIGVVKALMRSSKENQSVKALC